MNEMIGDLASWTYVYNIIIALYGFSVFAYWAVKRRGASAWYFYLMALILSIIIATGLQMYARYLLLNEDPYFTVVTTSLFWAVKSWICSITLTLIAIHATWRLRGGKTH